MCPPCNRQFAMHQKRQGPGQLYNPISELLGTQPSCPHAYILKNASRSVPASQDRRQYPAGTICGEALGVKLGTSQPAAPTAGGHRDQKLPGREGAGWGKALSVLSSAAHHLLCRAVQTWRRMQPPAGCTHRLWHGCVAFHDVACLFAGSSAHTAGPHCMLQHTPLRCWL